MQPCSGVVLIRNLALKHYLHHWYNLYTIGLQLLWASEREWLRAFLYYHILCVRATLTCTCTYRVYWPYNLLARLYFIYWSVSLSRHILFFAWTSSSFGRIKWYFISASPHPEGSEDDPLHFLSVGGPQHITQHHGNRVPGRGIKVRLILTPYFCHK